MAARAPSFKFKTEPAAGGEGSNGEEGNKEVDRLKQELELSEYGRQSAKRHVEDLRSEIKELMREVSKLKEDNATLQQQKEEAIQRERRLKQQLEHQDQHGVSNSGCHDVLKCLLCSVAYTSEGDEPSLLWIDSPNLSSPHRIWFSCCYLRTGPGTGPQRVPEDGQSTLLSHFVRMLLRGRESHTHSHSHTHTHTYETCM